MRHLPFRGCSYGRAFVAAFALASCPTFASTPPPTVDWPSYNDDLGSQRFATSNLLTKANVVSLHKLCTATLGNGIANLQSGPIVVGGIAYVSASADTYAIDGATCRVLWTNVYPLAAGLAGAPNRGVAYAGGRIFRGFADGHIEALDARTGAVIWNRLAIAPGSHGYFTAAPIAWRGAIFIGNAGGDTGEPGRLCALDQRTGATLWTMQTVPALGSPAARTWGGATHIGGGTFWTSFTLDATTGILYVPAGNPGPDFYAAARTGSDAGSDTVFAVNASTGAVLAGYQTVPADFHDWDIGATPTLVRIAGRDPVGFVAGKDGFVRAIDLANGHAGWATAVTTILNETAPIAVTGTHFCPGTQGGVAWNGAAYSPRTADLYVNSVDACVTLDLASSPPTYTPGRLWLGSTNSFGTQDTRRLGYLTALDESTGVVRWRYSSPAPMLAGVTPTAGGLVITGDLAGNVLVFDDTTGRLIRTVATYQPIAGGVVSYVTGGKAYVAVAAGMTSNPWHVKGVARIVVLGL